MKKKIMEDDISTRLEEEPPHKALSDDDEIQSHPEGDKGQINHLEKLGTDPNFKRIIVWKNAIGFLVLHLAAIYGLYLVLTFRIKILTFLWVVLLDMLSGEGVTMGAHRLFSHKSFKATFSLRLILILLHTLAGENCMYIWVRDHRQHHKFSDTDADPHNATRGFFFSHMGWLMSRKHPLVKEKGKTIDMSDLEADSLIMWQKKYYKPLYFAIALAIPIYIPVLVWGETVWASTFTSFFLRYVLILHQTWFVNSAAHLWGTKPFDKYLLPAENKFVAFVTGGEGWHNYHHTFPWDYRTSEFGSKFNATCSFIDIFAYWGMAFDLKTAPFKMIEQRTRRTGDGSHPIYGMKKVKTYRWEDRNMNEVEIDEKVN